MGILSLRIFPNPAPLFLPLRLLLALSYANKKKKKNQKKTKKSATSYLRRNWKCNKSIYLKWIFL